MKHRKKMMQDKINRYIEEGYTAKETKFLAKEIVAEPGTSEHEFGIAVDIISEHGLKRLLDSVINVPNKLTNILSSYIKSS